MDIKNDQLKCESCGSPLVRSRKFIASTNMYWNRPWGSALKMSAPVIPYACMNCGRIYLYLGDKKKIIREFNELPENEKKIIEEV
jgi:DNA-directed RNA polymerase subunit RPC12/RpoP